MPTVSDRIAEYDVFDLLDRVQRKDASMDVYGHEVKLTGLRLRTFKHKGIVCVRCGIIGTTFYVERDMYIGRGEDRVLNDGPFHLNLYGFTDIGKERLMTKDHILALSNGGHHTLDNMQTMCDACNRKKAHHHEWEIVKLNWNNILPPYKVEQ